MMIYFQLLYQELPWPSFCPSINKRIDNFISILLIIWKLWANYLRTYYRERLIFWNTSSFLTSIFSKNCYDLVNLTDCWFFLSTIYLYLDKPFFIRLYSFLVWPLCSRFFMSCFFFFSFSLYLKFLFFVFLSALLSSVVFSSSVYKI